MQFTAAGLDGDLRGPHPFNAEGAGPIRHALADHWVRMECVAQAPACAAFGFIEPKVCA